MSAFNELAGKVSKQYQKAKGKATADRIGKGVAFNIGKKKIGKKAMLAKARAARMRKMA